jgi:hypothetical protein
MNKRYGGSSAVLAAVVAGLVVVGVAGYRVLSPCSGGACLLKPSETAVATVAEEGYACGMNVCPGETTLANGELPACATACSVKDDCKGPCGAANGELPIAAGCDEKRSCGEKAGCDAEKKAACESNASECGEKAGHGQKAGNGESACAEKAKSDCCPLSQGG